MHDDLHGATVFKGWKNPVLEILQYREQYNGERHRRRDLRIPVSLRSNDERYVEGEEKLSPVAEDKNLTCRDCAKTFVFTAGEQAFFEEKGLSAPIRCPECRRQRKQQRSLDSPPSSPGMNGPRSSSAPPRSPGGPSRSGGEGAPGGGDRSSSPPRSGGFAPRAPRTEFDGDEERRGLRKARPPASVAAKFQAPKKEQTAVPKEKRPGNRRDEEKLLINWKEEVGLDDEDADSDWLAFGEDEEEA